MRETRCHPFAAIESETININERSSLMSCCPPTRGSLFLLRQQLHQQRVFHLVKLGKSAGDRRRGKLYDLGTVMTLAKFSRFASLVNGEVAHFPRQTVALFIAKLFTGNCLPRSSVKADKRLRELVDVSSADKILVFDATSLRSCWKIPFSCHRRARDKNASQDWHLTF